MSIYFDFNYNKETSCLDFFVEIYDHKSNTKKQAVLEINSGVVTFVPTEHDVIEGNSKLKAFSVPRSLIFEFMYLTRQGLFQQEMKRMHGDQYRDYRDKEIDDLKEQVEMFKNIITKAIEK